MPKQRRKSKPAIRSMAWERSTQGRLERLDSVAHYVDKDLLIYNIENVNLRAVTHHSMVQSVSGLDITTRNNGQEETVSNPENLQFEILSQYNILDIILSYLSLSDIIVLQSMNMFLKSYITSQYVPPLSLPMSQEVVAKLKGRCLLSLSSCCNLVWLPNIDTFEPFKQLNLSKLRELKLIGKNMDISRKNDLRLNCTYHRVLLYLLPYLSITSTLRKLEILVDETEASMESVTYIKDLVNLEELTLHGIGHFNNSCRYGGYPVDMDVANQLIEKSLWNQRIRALNLFKFSTNVSVLNSGLIVKSDQLERLSIMETKVIKVGYLQLPQLVSIETDILFNPLDQYVKYVKNKFKNLVAASCPKLKTWNGENLKELAKKSKTGRWNEIFMLPC